MGARRGLALGAAGALAAWVSVARGAPPEVFSGVALHPTDPERLVVAYVQGGQGLLFSGDGGRSFSLRCGAAVSSSFTRRRAPLIVAGDGEVLLGTFEGLVRGRSDGCGFGMAGELEGLQVADFARDPRDAGVTFMVTANARDGRATGLVRRARDGTLSAVGRSSGADAGGPEVSMNRLGVALRADGGLRFYASGLRLDAAGEAVPVVRHSDDEGESWVSHDVAGAEGARVVLVGVDPLDVARIAIALSREGSDDSVLVSSDGGESFESRLEIFELGASSVAPDGRLWVGDAGGEAEYSQPGGLYLFDDFGAAARKLATFPVRCLDYRAEPEAMFACQRETFGRVELATGSFTRLSSFTEVGGFVACEGEALATTCKQQLCDNWCGVLHYASAPLCDAYSEVSPLCGPPARGYGQAAPAAGDTPRARADEVARGDGGARDDEEPTSIPPTGAAPSTRSSAACRLGTGDPRSRGREGLMALAGLVLVLRRRERCNPDRARGH